MSNPLNKYLAPSGPVGHGVPNNGDIDQGVVDSFHRMANMLDGSGNAPGALMQLVKSNPQAAKVAELCSCRNPKDLFYAECRSRGLDADAIAKRLGIV